MHNADKKLHPEKKRPSAPTGSSPEAKKTRDEDLDDFDECIDGRTNDATALPLGIAPFPATVTTDIITKLLEDHAKDADKRTLSTITQAAAAMQTEIVAINTRVKQSDARTEKAEKDVLDLRKLLEGLDKKVLDLQANQNQQKEQTAKIEKTIAITDALPHARDGDTGAQRDPDQYDKKVVCINAQNPIAKDPLWKVLESKALPNAGIDPEAVDLKGPPLGRNFRLYFKGEGETPTLRARKFLNSFHTNGEWHNLTIDTPIGTKEQLYINADQSANTKTRNSNIKLLDRIIAETSPQVKTHKLLKEGAITADWQTIVHLRVDTKFSKPVWDPIASERFSLPTETISEIFTEKLAERKTARE
jgi:hypothetical protein